MSSSTTTTLESYMNVIVSNPTLLQFEEALASNPYNVKSWCNYFEALDQLVVSDDNDPNTQGFAEIRCFVGQRAVLHLPGSYKLWRNHLTFLKETTNKTTAAPPSSPMLLLIEEVYESALVRLHKAPRMWLDYMEFVFESTQDDITKIRHLINRALQALPVTQHSHIWELVFLKQQQHTNKFPFETMHCLYKRCCMVFPHYLKEFAEYCLQHEQWNQAASVYYTMLQQQQQQNTNIQTFHVWKKFCDICVLHATDIAESHTIDFDSIIRSVLDRNEEYQTKVQDDSDTASQQQQQQQQPLVFGEMEGTLWTQLATYHIRLGHFDMAKSIYQLALTKVTRVRDFSLVFDAYIQLQEGLMEAAMALEDEQQDQDDSTKKDEKEQDDDWNILLADKKEDEDATTDLELALERAEYLTVVQRPLLLNAVLLKQNPHNVGEWIVRADLFLKQDLPQRAISTLQQALNENQGGGVQSKHAVNGNPAQLVVKLANITLKEQSAQAARQVYQTYCQQPDNDGGGYHFHLVSDLSQCYTSWIEMELEIEEWDKALGVARQVTTPLKKSKKSKVHSILYKSVQLWDTLLDLEESLGTLQTTKDAYRRAFDLKVATPMHVIHCASYLTEKKYFEEAFAAYERGVEMFSFPHESARLLWKTYLQAFLKRYGGTKMERARDLFQRCLESCPPEHAAEFYMMQGQLEEEHGLVKRALSVYHDLCLTLTDNSEKATAFRLYITKTQQYLGVAATRQVYQEAIEGLKDNKEVCNICREFAQMETKLQEYERARAIYQYGAQMADPRRLPEYWQEWHDFEVSHGNEDSFREQLRIKRSVVAAFATVNYNAVEDTSDTVLTHEQAMDMIASREGMDVPTSTSETFKQQQQGAVVGGFVKEGKKRLAANDLDQVEDRVAKLRKATAEAASKATASHEDEDEIDLDDEEEIDLDEDEEEDDEGPTPPAASAAPIQGVSTKAVPAAVFGGLQPQAQEG